MIWTRFYPNVFYWLDSSGSTGGSVEPGGNPWGGGITPIDPGNM